jgi:endonuclease/exonuclease/phosphatase (EEP) superfamily protein YafD
MKNRTSSDMPGWAKTKDFAVRRIHDYTLVFFLLACAGSFFGYFGRWWFVFESMNSLRTHYILVLVLSLFVFAAFRKERLVFASIVFLILNLVAVFNPDRIRTGRDNGFRVLSVNLFWKNGRLPDVVKLIRAVDPDVLIVSELTGENLRGLEPIESAMPHKVIFPREDGFGLGLYSKGSPKESYVQTTPEAIPCISAVISEYTIYAAHPLHPTRPAYFRDREKFFDLLEKADNMIVAGDFNTVPWSHTMKRLKKRLSLVDVKTGFKSLVPTHLLYVPVDGALISNNLRLNKFEIIGIPGSDHKGILIEVSPLQE